MILHLKKTAIALLLTTIGCVTTGCGEQEITTVKTEADAIEILDLLNENGLPARKEEVGEAQNRQLRITVDEGWFGSGYNALAWQVLRDHGLPRDAGDDITIDSGPFVPQSEAELRMQQAREQRINIERQLRLMPGVTRVSVNIVPSQDPLFVVNRSPATASVGIVHREPQPPFTSQQIQQSVARSVQELRPENVTVTMMYQAPRPIPHQEIEARRRTNMITAGVIAAVGLLTLLLGALVLKSRRQRAQQTASNGETGRSLFEASVEGDKGSSTSPLENELQLENNEADEANADNRKLPATAQSVTTDGAATNGKAKGASAPLAGSS